MNRAFYIIGIVFAVVFFGVTGYYVTEVDAAQWREFYETYYNNDGYGYSSYSSYSGVVADITMEAGMWSLFFFLAFAAIDLLGLIKVKTKTMKPMAIIGLSITGIFLIWNFGVLTSPSSLSFDEVAPGWVLYCLIMLAFTIVGLVQSVRYHKRQSQPHLAVKTAENEDLLDS